ncbi:MAG TPA: ribosomal protein S18-alanine N-acetyltransferase [Azospirillaceae bacterium]|nr:ribosomal protein S18-alanine N-acetyltransferase [Azospirillaceae bacterium]
MTGIAALTLAHLGVAAAMHGECFPADPWDEAAIAGLAADPGAMGLIAVDGAEPAGFLLARSVADEAEILTICVRPGWRRRGIGRDLLRAAAAGLRSRGAVDLFLEVAHDNAPALGLYRGVGFLEVGRRRAYYRDGRDAIVMRGPLLGLL